MNAKNDILTYKANNKNKAIGIRIICARVFKLFLVDYLYKSKPYFVFLESLLDIAVIKGIEQKEKMIQ